MDLLENGMNREKSYYYEVDGVMRRTNYQAVGIHIYARSEGAISKISILNIMMQISSAIGLLLLAKYITDFIMLTMFREKNHYRNMKLLKLD